MTSKMALRLTRILKWFNSPPQCQGKAHRKSYLLSWMVHSLEPAVVSGVIGTCKKTFIMWRFVSLLVYLHTCIVFIEYPSTHSKQNLLPDWVHMIVHMQNYWIDVGIKLCTVWDYMYRPRLPVHVHIHVSRHVVHTRVHVVGVSVLTENFTFWRWNE